MKKVKTKQGNIKSQYENPDMRLFYSGFHWMVHESASSGYKEGFMNAMKLSEKEVTKICDFRTRFIYGKKDENCDPITAFESELEDKYCQLRLVFTMGFLRTMKYVPDINCVVYLFSWLEGVMEFWENYKSDLEFNWSINS